MTTFNTWDIVLVPFPFTDLSASKKRPALVISPIQYNKESRDRIILFMTSNLKTASKYGDYTLLDWKQEGLPKPTMVRMKFATIDKSVIIKKIGSISKRDRTGFHQLIAEFFT